MERGRKRAFVSKGPILKLRDKYIFLILKEIQKNEEQLFWKKSHFEMQGENVSVTEMKVGKENE